MNNKISALEDALTERAQNFDEWFDSRSYSEEHREMFCEVWNEAIDNASKHFSDCEGWDHGVKDLKS